MNSQLIEQDSNGKHLPPPASPLMVRQSELEFKALNPNFWLSLPIKILGFPALLEKIFFHYRELGIEGIFLQVDIEDVSKINPQHWQSLQTWIQVGPLPLILKVGIFSPKNLQDSFAKSQLSNESEIIDALFVNESQKKRELGHFLDCLWKLFQVLKSANLNLNQWLLVHEGFEKSIPQKCEALLNELNSNYWGVLYSLKQQSHQFWQELLLQLNQKLHEEVLSTSTETLLSQTPLKIFIFEQNNFCKKIPLGVDLGQIFFSTQSHFNQYIFPELLLHNGVFDFQYPIDWNGQLASPLSEQGEPFAEASQQLEALITLLSARRKYPGLLTPTISLISQYPLNKSPIVNTVVSTGTAEKIVDITSALFKLSSNRLFPHELKPSLLHELDQLLHQNGYSCLITTIDQTPGMPQKNSRHIDIICEIFKDWPHFESALQLFVNTHQSKVFLVSETLFNAHRYPILGFFKSLEFSEIIVEEENVFVFFESWIDKEKPFFSLLVVPEKGNMTTLFSEETINRLLRFHQVSAPIKCLNPQIDFVASTHFQTNQTICFGYIRNNSPLENVGELSNLNRQVLFRSPLQPFETQFFEFVL